MNRQTGFTLIELVLVIIILSVASVPLFGMFSQAGVSMLSNESIQTAAQLAQERAEHLVAIRRNQGYSAAEVSSGLVENLTGNYSGYTRTTTINGAYTGSDCPALACKQLTIAVAQAGQTYAQISFVLVDY